MKTSGVPLLASLLLMLGLVLLTACGGRPQVAPDRVEWLESTVDSWELATTSLERARLMERILLGYAMARDGIPLTPVPSRVLDTVGHSLVLDRVAQDLQPFSADGGRKIGNLWFIEGLRVSGSQLVDDPGQGLPQVQSFSERADMVVHISPDDGVRVIVRGQQHQELGIAQPIRIP